MTALVHQRCLNHADREAAARCPECKKFFCRECISEHDGRILCAACLRKILSPPSRQTRDFEGLYLAGQSLVAALIIWFFFFLVAQGLLAIPASFHADNLWETELE